MASVSRTAQKTKAWRRGLASFDNQRRRKFGVDLIGGVDEAGRGPLAGPVVAACVVLAEGVRLPGLDDSKSLTPDEREALAPRIIDRAAAWGVGLATAAEIDRINILQATHLAARRAIAMIQVQPQHMLTDFLKLRDVPCAVEPLIDGDASSQAIAAASILAKVARDRIMKLLHDEYPQYGFASHKGYAVPVHWAALRNHGPSTLHRLTYTGVTPEPFFGTETLPPLVRCRRLAVGDGALPPAPPVFDPPPFCWRGFITRKKMDPADYCFLPELEWSCRQAASLLES